MKRLQYIWEQVSGSFWLIPLLLLLLAVGASAGLISLDRLVNYRPHGALRFLFAESPGSARSILTVISGAMIGVAGTVFSITLVALTLASSQFGPRLLRNFMYDRINQVVLGAYLALFVYCLIVMNSVSEAEEFRFVPLLSVLAAILVAVINIVLLIVFIHHVALSIQSDNVVSNISAALSKSIATMFPGEADEDRDAGEPGKTGPETLKKEWPVMQTLTSQKSGYLQSVDHEQLVRFGSECDFVIALPHKPGDYLVEAQKLCEVYARQGLTDGQVREIHDAFILGKVRTPLQDPEFAIHQMVEIASRALSPGINDPYTAIACIDNLSAVMCYLTRVNFTAPCRYDANGALRLVADSLTFDRMLDAAFNQIRQLSGGLPSVMIRLMEALVTIYEIATQADHKKAAARHAAMVFRMAERVVNEPDDLKDLQVRYDRMNG